jgi:hypothetical protein
VRSGQIANIRQIIESGGSDGMILMDTSLMNRVKDGTIEPKEAYMKAANKAAFAPLLKPGDLELEASATEARGAAPLKTAVHGSQPFSSEMRQHAFNHSQQLRMGQTTRSQGISFTHEMWARIEARCREPEVRPEPVLPDAGRVGPALPARDPRAQGGREVALLPRAGRGPRRREHLRAAEDPPEPAPRRAAPRRGAGAASRH